MLKEKLIGNSNLTKHHSLEVKNDDYACEQLEVIGQVIKTSLNKRQQFKCLYGMNNVWYKYITGVGCSAQKCPAQPQQPQQASTRRDKFL